MAKDKITKSSTAEYFAKNLQQVGFSSPTKAVLTILKEAVDNSLDACEDHGILPDLVIEIEKVGSGTLKNTDLIRIRVEDNGPGLHVDDVPKVFGEYLASSKFGRGRCSRGQQGIGISAATTWAQLTSARGAKVITKTKKMRQAVELDVNVDIKQNKGTIKNKKSIDWKKTTGLSAEFFIDGRAQINGEGGLITYINGTSLVNPHASIQYKLPGQEKYISIERVSDDLPSIPDSTDPHPHTMKLGEFIHHSHLFGKMTLSKWLKKGFSRISDNIINNELTKNGLKKEWLNKACSTIPESDFKIIYSAIQNTDLMAPTTKSVMTIGEAALSKSVLRLGEIDFFSVVTRKPKICDSKPVAVEVAVARLLDKKAKSDDEGDSRPVTVLRFANRVPLQFDKAACAISKSIESVSWRSYGLSQSRGNLPTGPYVIAVSVVSPFIKFKNASKETIDASDELVEEIRRTLMQAGQRLSRHIKKEKKEQQLEEKLKHIEQFCPILIDCLMRITKAPAGKRKKATAGLSKILGREVDQAKDDLTEAQKAVKKAAEKKAKRLGIQLPAKKEDIDEATPPKETPSKKKIQIQKKQGSQKT